MPTGVPASKAAELFNRLTSIQFDDCEEARRIGSELQALNKQRPGDFTTKVALAEALLICGRRDDAINQIDGAFSVRRRTEWVEMDRLALLYFFTANPHRAVQIVKEVAFQPGVVTSTAALLGGNHAQVAAWAADLDLLKRLADRDEKASHPGAAIQYLENYMAGDATEDLVACQRAAIEPLRDCQVAITFAISPDELGFPLLINNVIFDPARKTRRELETQIRAVLDSYSQNSPQIDGRVVVVVTASSAPAVGPLRVVGAGPVPA